MSAQEVWFLLALIAGALSAVLRTVGAPPLPAVATRAAGALLGASLACLAAGLWVAL